MLRLLCLCLISILTSPLAAQPVQWLAPLSQDHRPQSIGTIDLRLALADSTSGSDIVGPVLGGLIVGTVGFFGGGMIGYSQADRWCNDDSGWCPLGGMFLGAITGETLGVPLGVHIGSKKKGSLALTLLGTTAVTGLMLTMANDFEGSSPVLLLAVPATQIGVAMAINHQTRR